MAKRKSHETEKSVKKPIKTQPQTQFSICVPSSAISASNAHNLQQITHVAYQIAKYATIFNCPEVVILDVPSTETRRLLKEKEASKVIKLDKKITFNEPEVDKISDKEAAASAENDSNALLLATLLQFFITPPYLVKSVFKDSPMNKKFKYAYQLPKVSTLPFMNNNAVISDFKEGLSIPKKSPGSSKSKNKLKATKYVNIGEDTPLVLDNEIPVNVRVTVDVKNKKVVAPLTAYGVIGNKSSFGFYTRIAKTLPEIFTQSSYPDGYSSSIYINCADYFSNDISQPNTIKLDKDDNKVLLVFGSRKDLKFSFEKEKMGVESFTELFDHKFEIPPCTRVEDGLPIALSKLDSSI